MTPKTPAASPTTAVLKEYGQSWGDFVLQPGAVITINAGDPEPRWIA
jgi:hypothetical protein